MKLPSISLIFSIEMNELNSLHGIFASFYREEFIEITKKKDSRAMYECLKMIVPNVSAIIICEKAVGKPTQACLILTTSVSNVDDSCKACKLT